MKILIASTYDTNGGAGRAAFRLHQGLQDLGLNSQMLVQYKSSDDKTILAPHRKLEQWIAKLKPTVDDFPLQFYRDRNEQTRTFSVQWVQDWVPSIVKQLNPDVINLHWISGYIQLESLAKFSRPIVWTLHDMWGFTGGCHYSQDCDRYIHSCGSCHVLGSKKDQDLSRWVWLRKARSWKGLNLTIVTPSKWLAECAKSSSLFKDVRVEVIPNSLDTQKYKPINRAMARECLNLPQDRQLVLFGSASPDDPRKGFILLQNALLKLSLLTEYKDKIQLIVFGTSQSQQQINMGFKTHYLGNLKDDVSLALAYAAADIFVAPSIQDNLPNTIMEALACGIPCVAFNIGGIPDMIEHEQNGYLVKPFDVEDLSKGISSVLVDKQRHQALCQGARKKAVQEFSLEVQAQRYSNLFVSLKENSFDARRMLVSQREEM